MLVLAFVDANYLVTQREIRSRHVNEVMETERKRHGLRIYQREMQWT